MELIDLIHKNQTEYLKPVCIDNKKVRKQLSESKNIQIQTVPTIIIVYPNNSIEKFESPRVYDWVKSQILGELAPQVASQVSQVVAPVVSQTQVAQVSIIPPSVPSVPSAVVPSVTTPSAVPDAIPMSSMGQSMIEVPEVSDDYSSVDFLPPPENANPKAMDIAARIAMESKQRAQQEDDFQSKKPVGIKF